ncbi:uncharacterized protein LOC133463593 isoform X2 [Cololabis saira]|uniref:uncharacterized protein LOC133463593 isoform X2 n=1 Tax=Cololabis saira TaxID=129043 RepID=UPI002AD4232B|nr:uncharacterized protein LOC133463593 isoform X2 [Cololabis saira]
MDGGLTITFISVAMFVGSFFLGFIPLLFRLSERSLQFVSILGAGLLCGTALAITIPEGVGLLEDAWKASSSDVPSALNGSRNSSTEGDSPPPRFYIGVALTFGFTFMFVVDQIGGYLSIRDAAAAQQHPHHSHAGAGYSLCSRRICPRRCGGHGAGDGTSHRVFGRHSTQGPGSLRTGLLSDARGPREEVHSGTFTGIFSCSAHSCYQHVLHITCIRKLLPEPAQCDGRGDALLRRDLPLRCHGACSP